MLLAPTTPEAPRAGGWELGSLALVVGVGGFLRFYHLGAPSLWWDEMIVGLMARFPAPLILQWASVFEPNPPLYHILNKLPLWLGGSEALLRAPSALAGTATVALLHGFCRSRLSVTAGLVAAALLAVNPLHILMSRQVRPYTAVLLLFVCALGLLLRYARAGKGRDLALLAGCNALAVGLHYGAVLFLAAQAAWMWGLALFARSGEGARLAVRHTLSLAASFAPVAFFFFSTAFVRRDIVNAPLPVGDLAARLPDLLARMAVFEDGIVPGLGGPLLWALSALAFLGFWRALLESPRAGSLLAVTTLATLGLILAGRTGFLFPRYIFHVYLCLTVFQGVAVAWVIGRHPVSGASAAALLALAGGVWIPWHYQQAFYQADSYRHFGPGGTYRQDAQALEAARSGSGFTSFEDEGLRQSLRWYATRSLEPGPGDAQALSPDEGEVRVVLAASAGDEPSPDAARVLAGSPPPDAVNVLERVREYVWQVRRAPVQTTDPAQVYFTLDANPARYAAVVNASRHVTLDQARGGSIMPSANGVDGEFRLKFVNPEGVWFHQVYVELPHDNVGQDNLLKVWAGFDGREDLVFASRGPDPRGVAKVHLFSDRPFKEFSLRVTLRCEAVSPNYPGSNLDTLRVRRAVVGFLCPVDGRPR